MIESATRNVNSPRLLAIAILDDYEKYVYDERTEGAHMSMKAGVGVAVLPHI